MVWCDVVGQLLQLTDLNTSVCSNFVFLKTIFEINNEDGLHSTRVGTLIVATIYLQLIQNRYMFRSFTVLQCRHQHSVQPVASDVEVVGYL